MSDIFRQIIFIQNKLLLEKIADKKYTNENDKQKFIDRYHKLNYHHVDIVRDSYLFESYSKRATIMQ